MSFEGKRDTHLIWPDDKPDQHIVEVKLDSDRTVAFLKELIKNEHSHRFHDVDARDLVLWRCSIPADDNLKNALNAICFDGVAPDLLCLPAASLLSNHFATGLSRNHLHPC